MNPFLYLPLLITDAPTAVAITLASLVMTAPDPALSVSLAPGHIEMFVTAPDPVVAGSINLDMLTVGVTAPEPGLVSPDEILVLDTGPIGVTAPDVRIEQPATILLNPAAANITALDPDIQYGFVVSSTVPGYNAAPSESTTPQEHGRQVANVVNRLMQGKGNTSGTVTLVANVEKTYLRDDRFAPESVVQFDAMTATAAAEKAAGTIYVLAADRQARQWLITHANAASTDRTFRYTVFG